MGSVFILETRKSILIKKIWDCQEKFGQEKQV